MTDSEVTVYFDFPRDCLEPTGVGSAELITIEFNRGPMCWKVTGYSAVRYTSRKWHDMVNLDHPQVMRFRGTKPTLAIYRESDFIIFRVGPPGGVGVCWGAPVAECRVAFEAVAAGMANYMRQVEAKRAANDLAAHPNGGAMPAVAQ